MKENKSEFKKCKKLLRSNEVFDGLVNTKWFIKWLKVNMHLYFAFEQYALDLKQNGKRKRYSARAIVHRMRWDTFFTENAPSSFKITNNCTPYLARLVMLRHGILEGMFSLSTSKRKVSE